MTSPNLSLCCADIHLIEDDAWCREVLRWVGKTFKGWTGRRTLSMPSKIFLFRLDAVWFFWSFWAGESATLTVVSLSFETCFWSQVLLDCRLWIPKCIIRTIDIHSIFQRSSIWEPSPRQLHPAVGHIRDICRSFGIQSTIPGRASKRSKWYILSAISVRTAWSMSSKSGTQYHLLNLHPTDIDPCRLSLSSGTLCKEVFPARAVTPSWDGIFVIQGGYKLLASFLALSYNFSSVRTDVQTAFITVKFLILVS